MKRNPAALFFVAAVVAAMLFVGFHAARRAGGDAGADSLEVAGKPAPDFTLQSLDGKIVAREFGLQSRSLFVDNIKKALSQGHAVQAQK